MLIVLASFVLILFLSTCVGLLILKPLADRIGRVYLAPMVGLCTIMVLSCFWSFFGALGWIFEGFLIGLGCGCAFVCKEEFEKWWNNFYIQLFQFSPAPFFVFMRWLLLVVIIAQCSAAPFVLDNESYYIQTIKWLDQYGTVKGLANLHVYLAQGSGWHYAQAALNFDGVFNRLNDLSGFILLLGGWWSLDRLHAYYERGKDWIDLCCGLFLIPSVFFAQFIGAPSPDVPIYVLTFVQVWLFVSLWRKPEKSCWVLLVFLGISCVFIKVTSGMLLLFPLILFFKTTNVYSRSLPVVTVLALSMGGLFIVKNYYLSGYLLFPLQFTDWVAADWKLTEGVIKFYGKLTRAWAYQIPIKKLEQLTTRARYLHWLTMPGLHGLLNKVLAATLLVIPLILAAMPHIHDRYHKLDFKLLWKIYYVFFLQSMLILATSPQYRFYFNLLLFIWMLPLAFMIRRSKFAVKSLIFIGVAAPLGLLLLPSEYSYLTKNEYMNESVQLSNHQILLPHPNTRFPIDYYESYKTYGLKVWSHPEFDFYYGTGDAPLPAAGPKMLYDFARYYNTIPEKRGRSLGDGFRARPLD